MRQNYKHTIYACYLGYITQAIIVNLAPLLFLTFQKEFGIGLDKIASLITVNFGVQLTADLLAAKYVDKIGQRTCVVAAHVFSAAGLIGLAVLPGILPPYIGLLLAVGLYGVGGGLIEVLVSPIVEACPTEGKEAAMSLLHSFYCWGQVLVVLLSTLYFALFQIESWRILAVIWAIVPVVNAFWFTRVPINTLVEEGEGLSIRQLFTSKIFLVLCVLMVCAGASELCMSQWASAFAESGLGVSKAIGDLTGPCLFAALMGTTRALYAKFSTKIPLQKFMVLSGLLSIVSYLLAALTKNPILGLAGCSLCGVAAGIMWPGTFSIAAKRLPKGGTAMFALLALAGDLGCVSGPTTVGVVSEAFGGDLKMGLLFSIAFPILLLIGLFTLIRMRQKA